MNQRDLAWLRSASAPLRNRNLVFSLVFTGLLVLEEAAINALAAASGYWMTSTTSLWLVVTGLYFRPPIALHRNQYDKKPRIQVSNYKPEASFSTSQLMNY